MEKKVKLTDSKDRALIPMTCHIHPDLYERLGKMSQELKVSKKALINTGIGKILDDIEQYGIEL